MKPKIALTLRRDDGGDVALAGAHQVLDLEISCRDGELVKAALLVEVLYRAAGDVPEFRLSAAGKFAWGDIYSDAVPCWPPVPMEIEPPDA